MAWKGFTTFVHNKYSELGRFLHRNKADTSSYENFDDPDNSTDATSSAAAETSAQNSSYSPQPPTPRRASFVKTPIHAGVYGGQLNHELFTNDTEGHSSYTITEDGTNPEDQRGNGVCEEEMLSERGTWTGKLDFLLSCLGYAVGLGNIWRFPYMCYRNGGGAFLIPYTLFLIFVGIPVFLLDISLGQFTSNGPLTCWEFAPIVSGIGYGMVVISSLVGIYYNVIIAYALYYLFASMSQPLPWSGCNNTWNTQDCRTRLTVVNCSLFLNRTARPDGQCFNAISNESLGLWNEDLFINVTGRRPILPAQEYFNNAVLGLTSGIDDIGAIRWRIVLCLLAGWIVVFLCMMQGIKSSGKIVYFTSLLPYVLLIILFFRGVTLKGAKEGISFYIVPDFSKLRHAEVWKDAANQVFFSLSASWGGLITLASYNRFHNNVIRDSIIVSLCNCGTSVFAGFVIFSFLGHLAYVMNTSVDRVADKGMGLAFIVYPEAVNTLPASTFWAILFFLMLLLLGLDSQFTMIETVITAVKDKFRDRLRPYKIRLILGFCILYFLLGLPMTTGGGPYLLQLMDSYCGGWSVLLVALLEILTIGWLYGRPGFNMYRRPMRFQKDIELMIGKDVSLWWRITWQYTAPILLAGIILFSWIDYKPARYGNYYYPIWADVLGWMMTLSSVIWVPIIIFYIVWKDKDPIPWYKRFWALTWPTHKWGPALSKHRRLVVRYLEDPSDFYIDVQQRIKYSDLLRKEQQLETYANEHSSETTTRNNGRADFAFTNSAAIHVSLRDLDALDNPMEVASTTSEPNVQSEA